MGGALFVGEGVGWGRWVGAFYGVFWWVGGIPPSHLEVAYMEERLSKQTAVDCLC